MAGLAERSSAARTARTTPARSHRRMALAVVGALVVTLGVTGTPSVPAAHAAFPGENGLLTYEVPLHGHEIETLDPSTGARTVILDSATEPFGGFEPVWSPDGTRIRFSAGGPGIFVMASNGDHPTQVTTEGWSPSWSPDGARLVYINSSGALATINVDGTDAQVVFDGSDLPDDGYGSYLAPVLPQWSPDGQKILFEVLSGPGTNTNAGFWAVAPDGTGLVQIARDASGTPAAP